ncbi:MAG: OmpH family outer membrane protein, partial [Bacteroidales bacterium]|nr:OmpH family outer membrane protein [Bacteroidales bacterium]
MKKVNVLLALLIASSLFLGVNAQSKLKLAHVSSSELMKIMPGVDTVQKALESYYTQLEDEVKAMVAEYQQKVADFQDKLPTMSQSLQKVKTEEIQDLQTRIQRFQ